MEHVLPLSNGYRRNTTHPRNIFFFDEETNKKKQEQKQKMKTKHENQVTALQSIERI